MNLTVQGMTCGHCVAAISRAVDALGGRAQVDLTRGTVTVEGTTDVAAVRRAIEDEGYTVVDVQAADAQRGGGSGGSCCGCRG